MDARQLLGLRVKSIRQDLGLSQEELAFQCGMHASHIGFLERGQRNPSLDTLERLALGMDISLSELLDFDQPPRLELHDDATNKIMSYVAGMTHREKKQLLMIIKALKFESE